MRILISVYVLKTFYVFLWPLFFSLFIYSLEISEYFLIYRTSTIYPTLLLQRAFPFPFLYHLLIPRERNLGILFFFFLPGKNPRSTRTILVFDYSYSIETRGAEIIWSRAAHAIIIRNTALYVGAWQSRAIILSRGDERGRERSNVEINTMHSPPPFTTRHAL